TNKQGRSNGIFDSGLFGPKKSWSYNFTESGRYTYFCTIHPWMEGVIVVELGEWMEQQQEQQEKEIEIPAYPVNASGDRLDTFPVHTLTNDNKYDIDMVWDPNVIVVGEPANFILNFFDWPSNKKSHLLPYDFVIERNGIELDRISDLVEVGADIQKIVFAEPGPVTIRIANVGNTPAYTEFNTLVYENPKEPTGEGEVSALETGIISEQTNVSKLISPLTLVYITYAIIVGLPAAVTVIVILYRKGKI
ncbi:MAG: cupredoxin domain-containing protein, partial [Nitrososphaeraceae archaeon]